MRLGKAIALRLAAEGMNIALHYSASSEAAALTLSELTGLGVRADSVAADFQQSARAARSVLSFARERFESVDVLVNSAAIFEAASLLQTSEEQWDRHFNINLKAAFFLSQEFVRGRDPQASGAIVNIADWRGVTPVPGHAAYTLTKAALVAQTKLLAQELGPRIRVNAVAPGAILPAPGASGGQFAERAKYNPLQRTGHPDDVCDAVVFLLKSDFVTGEILHVTGGEQFSPGQAYGN